MSTEFRTSFIPKKTLAKTQKTPQVPVSLLLVVSSVVFFIVAIAAGGMYYYQLSVERSIEEKKEHLARAKEAFEPASILRFQQLDRRLTHAERVLEAHISVTPVFTLLERTTIRPVQFTSFNYSYNNGLPSITLDGVARDYMALAFQADVFNDNPDIRNPVFSGLEADPNSGTVSFSVTAALNPRVVSYKENFSGVIDQQQ